MFRLTARRFGAMTEPPRPGWLPSRDDLPGSAVQSQLWLQAPSQSIMAGPPFGQSTSPHLWDDRNLNGLSSELSRSSNPLGDFSYISAVGQGQQGPDVAATAMRPPWRAAVISRGDAPLRPAALDLQGPVGPASSAGLVRARTRRVERGVPFADDLVAPHPSEPPSDTRGEPALVRLAQAQIQDPDVRDQIRERNRELGRPLGSEGVYDTIRLLPRDAYNRVLREGARVSISRTIGSRRTSPVARGVLRSFLTGEGPRSFYFGPHSAAVRELFQGNLAGYYRREEIEAMNYIAHDRERRGYLQDGDEVTEHKFRDFGLVEYAGLRDGAQIGDITGTFSDGVSARVRGNRVHFRAVNRMNLVSFAAGNMLPVQERFVDLPNAGPLSEVRMVFEWSRPIPPHLRRRNRR